MLNASAMKSSLFSSNVAWCSRIKHPLARRVSWVVQSGFFFVFFCIFQGGISQRQVSAMEQTRDKVGTIFFSRSTPRAFLVRPALGSRLPQKHKKKKKPKKHAIFENADHLFSWIKVKEPITRARLSVSGDDINRRPQHITHIIIFTLNR